MPQLPQEQPECLRPYIYHGLDLQWRANDKDAVADCLYCGREGKFNVKIENGQFRCVICGSSGNTLVFLRKLWEVATERTTQDQYEGLAEDRKLYHASTLREWQLAVNPLTGNWIIPGYGAKAAITGLYQYLYGKGRYRWLPTPTMGHHLWGLHLYDPAKPTVYVCEGLWDGATWWECLSLGKQGEDCLVPTANRNVSLLAEANVLIMPTASTFFESWCPWFAGKRVCFMAQNDHPKMNEVTKTMSPSASYAAMERAARMLSNEDNPPLSMEVLMWGDEGHDPDMPSGYDLRDHINA